MNRMADEGTTLHATIDKEIRENNELKSRVDVNESKYEALLKEFDELKKAMSDGEISNEDGDKIKSIENRVKVASIECKILKEDIKKTNSAMREAVDRLDSNEQYLKLENLVMEGIPQQAIPLHLKGYRFSIWVANTINNLIPNLDFPILPCHISVSHPLYISNKYTVIIVRFANRDVRNEVFYKKKYICDRKITIKEHLTKKNRELYNEILALLGENKAWTSQTKLYGRIGNDVIQVKSKADIETLAKLKHQNEIESSKRPETRQTPTDNSNNSTNNMISTVPPTSQSHDFRLLRKTWPNVSEAEIITAVRNYKHNDSTPNNGVLQDNSSRGHFNNNYNNRNGFTHYSYYHY